MRCRVVIVNDGNVDNTGEVLASIDDARVVITEHVVNRGKGAAVRTAASLASGDCLLSSMPTWSAQPTAS